MLQKARRLQVVFGALNKGGQIKVDLVDGQVEFTELTKEKVT